MRLRKLILTNFRGYAEPTPIEIGDLTAFIGRNDVGKSTILHTLEIFFNNEVVKIDAKDACVHTKSKTVEIACVFDELPDELVIDSRSRTSLEQEYLLNGEGQLEIVMSYNCGVKTPKPDVFARADHPTAEGAVDLLQLLNDDLKSRAEELDISLDDVDRRSNSAIREAIRAGVGALAPQLILVPLDDADARKAWTQLQKELLRFALFRADRESDDQDAEVADPMKAAVKEAIAGVQGELDEIRRKVRDHALEVATRTLAKLDELAPELATALRPDFTSEPQWHGFKLGLSDQDGVPINKRGSGVRRLILLSFFRAEAERRQQEDEAPGIIFTVEEPESSQHPSNQRMLIEALSTLSDQENTQVILTTHVPAIARLLPKESITVVSANDEGRPRVERGADDLFAVIADELGVLPDSRAKVLLHVEGPNDIACLERLARVLRLLDDTLPDLATDPRVAVILAGGTTLQHYVNKRHLAPLDLPEWHLYDRDTEVPPRYQAAVDDVNARGGRDWARLTTKREMENYLHPEAIAEALGVEVTFDDHDDVPEIVARALHDAAEDAGPWDDLTPEKKGKKCSSAKKRLNADAAAKMTLAHLAARDPDGEVRGWFEQLRGMLA